MNRWESLDGSRRLLAVVALAIFAAVLYAWSRPDSNAASEIRIAADS